MQKCWTNKSKPHQNDYMIQMKKKASSLTNSVVKKYCRNYITNGKRPCHRHRNNQILTQLIIENLTQLIHFPLTVTITKWLNWSCRKLHSIDSFSLTVALSLKWLSIDHVENFTQLIQSLPQSQLKNDNQLITQ